VADKQPLKSGDSHEEVSQGPAQRPGVRRRVTQGERAMKKLLIALLNALATGVG
jgi:hypothetical protein